MSPKQQQHTHRHTQCIYPLRTLQPRLRVCREDQTLICCCSRHLHPHRDTPTETHSGTNTITYRQKKKKMNKSASYHLLFFSIYETAGGKMHFVAAAVKAVTTGLQYRRTAECNDWGLCYNSNSLLAAVSTNKNNNNKKNVLFKLRLLFRAMRSCNLYSKVQFSHQKKKCLIALYYRNHCFRVSGQRAMSPLPWFMQ